MRLATAFFGLTLYGSPAHAGGCEDPKKTMLDAENEIVSFFLADAEKSLDATVRALSCSSKATDDFAARLMRAKGMLLFLRADSDGAGERFAAARTLDPDGWNPDFGVKAKELFDAATPVQGASSPLKLRNLGRNDWVAVDGMEVASPFKVEPGFHLIQVGDADGPSRFAQVLGVGVDEPIELTVPEPLAPPREVAAGDCPAGASPTTTSVVAAQLQGVELVTASRDPGKINPRAAALRAGVGCIDQVIPKSLAARYHRMRGILADPLGTGADRSSFIPALRTAKTLSPGLTIDDGLLPSDHSVRVAFEALGDQELETARVRTPRTGKLAFDGAISLDRPVNGATVFQRIDAEGTIIETVWLDPTAELPSYQVKPVMRTVLFVSAALLGGTAGGLYVGAVASESALLENPPRDPSSSIRRTNGLFLSSVVVALVAGGTAAGGVAVGPR